MRQHGYPGRHLVSDLSTAARHRYDAAINEFKLVRDPCEAPVVLAGIGLPSPREKSRPSKLPFEVIARCRKCASCLRARQRLWTARAVSELLMAHRTWFGTLTVHPARRFLMVCEAAGIARRAGHREWPLLEASVKLRYLARVLLDEATKYFKRLRKAGADFVYLLVAEPHKDEFPHLHVLLHERALPATKRLLESKWRFGFSHFRLVDSATPKTVFYVCKYLTKTADVRVRASQRYGRAAPMGGAGTECNDAGFVNRESGTLLPGPL